MNNNLDISVKNFDAINYQEDLGEFLMSLKKIEENAYSKFNQDVYSACNERYDQIFEIITGGIKILDYEWVLDHSVYKKVFATNINDSLFYAVNTDDAILLRGPKVYYYLVSHKTQYHNPTSEQVLEWKNNIEKFIHKLQNAILLSMQEPKVYSVLLEKKYLLGILDHIRHFSLICFNAEMILKNRNNDSFIEDVFQEKHFKDYFDTMGECYMVYEKILFHNFERSIVLEYIANLLTVCNTNINKVFGLLISLDDSKLIGRCLKLHREADSFVENYIAVKHSMDILKVKYSSENNVKMFAILNGAIEFPLLIYHFMQKANYTYYYVNIPGDYLQRHNNKCDAICINHLWKNKGVMLEDNTMTGSTLEVAYDYIQENLCCNIDSFFVLRHPEINRIPQMKAYNKAVNIEFLKRCCIGLLNHTPYSKIKFDTNYYEEYLDELGVFTLTGDFFLKFLLKNGLYEKNSEVDKVGRFRIQ